MYLEHGMDVFLLNKQTAKGVNQMAGGDVGKVIDRLFVEKMNVRNLETSLKNLRALVELEQSREMAALRQLLERPGLRLVTITGPFGVGKSGLASAVAHAMQNAFIDDGGTPAIQQHVLACTSDGRAYQAVAEAPSDQWDESVPILETMLDSLNIQN